MAKSYLSKVFPRLGAEPVSQPLRGRESDMTLNNTGGYTFRLSDFAQVERFLLLGSEGGSYYVSEKKLTMENAEATLRAIQADGPRVVKMAEEISFAGKAPKNDPALFVLALCFAFGDAATKEAARAALPRVARIGTHLFHFAEYVAGMRGWGRCLKSAVAQWYLAGKSAEDLAYDAVKYQQRDGWSHQDLVRLSHPKAADAARNIVLHYIAKGWEDIGPDAPEEKAVATLWAFERAKRATSDKDILPLIADYNLPMECVPTELRTAAVYEALLPKSGLTWLLRNLGNLSRTGALAKGQFQQIETVTRRLTNPEELRRGRVHPLAILVALNTYQQGHGVKGAQSWPVVPEIVDALDTAFYLAFQQVEPSGARFVLGCDISSSMLSGTVGGMTGITPRLATAVMAMASKRVEKQAAVMGFSHKLVELPITPSMRLDAIVQIMDVMPFGATRIALPMEWALEKKVKADCFVIYTDNEVNTGGHPVNALKRYREKMGIDAKLIVVAMTPTHFSVADPNDPGMLDIHGFSTDTPAVISHFAKGHLSTAPTRG